MINRDTFVFSHPQTKSFGFWVTQLERQSEMHSSNAMAIIHVVLWAIAASLGTFVTEDHENLGLKSIPDNLNPDTEVLLLKKNNIWSISNNSLINYPNLTALDVQKNSLQYIHDGAFQNNPKLQYLSVAYNGLRYIPADFGPAKYSLVKISFYMAMAIELKNMNFSEFSMLHWLVFGGNPFSKFDASNLPRSLGKFHIGTAYITVMPNFLPYSPNITTIRVHGNKLSSIPAELIVGLTRLKELFVQNNKLETIPDLYDLPLISLRIDNNPLICNESLCWVRLWARKKPVALAGLEAAVCYLPDSHEMKSLWYVDPAVMGCYRGKYVHVGKISRCKPFTFLFVMMGWTIRNQNAPHRRLATRITVCVNSCVS